MTHSGSAGMEGPGLTDHWKDVEVWSAPGGRELAQEVAVGTVSEAADRLQTWQWAGGPGAEHALHRCLHC